MSNDLTQRLAKIWGELDPVDEWREDIADAIDALTDQEARVNAALNLWPRDCRLCANYTTSSGGCTSAVQCVDSDQFKTTTPRQYWKAVTP